MAGLKKPVKKRDTTSPNTALVLFLVFFVLLSIGLGVWGYFGYSGQDKLRETTKKAQVDSESAQKGLAFNKFVASDTRLALGHPLSADELTTWKSAIDNKGLDDGGKFAAENAETRTAMKKMIDDNRAE